VLLFNATLFNKFTPTDSYSPYLKKKMEQCEYRLRIKDDKKSSVFTAIVEGINIRIKRKDFSENDIPAFTLESWKLVLGRKYILLRDFSRPIWI
jgi:hypothetical protein